MGDLDLLEQGEAIMLIKSYEVGKEPPLKHLQIARLCVRMANLDSPGTITFVMVWGLGPNTDRKWRVFDWTTGRDGQTFNGKRRDWQQFLADWFKAHKGRR